MTKSHQRRCVKAEVHTKSYLVYLEHCEGDDDVAACLDVQGQLRKAEAAAAAAERKRHHLPHQPIIELG